MAGTVIILFRLVIDYVQAGFLPGAVLGNYETLNWQTKILLTTCGGLILGVIFHLALQQKIQVGVIHVLERLNYHEGHLPLKNAILQFVGESFP